MPAPGSRWFKAVTPQAGLLQLGPSLFSRVTRFGLCSRQCPALDHQPGVKAAAVNTAIDELNTTTAIGKAEQQLAMNESFTEVLAQGLPCSIPTGPSAAPVEALLARLDYPYAV